MWKRVDKLTLPYSLLLPSISQPYLLSVVLPSIRNMIVDSSLIPHQLLSVQPIFPRGNKEMEEGLKYLRFNQTFFHEIFKFNSRVHYEFDQYFQLTISIISQFLRSLFHFTQFVFFSCRRRSNGRNRRMERSWGRGGRGRLQAISYPSILSNILPFPVHQYLQYSQAFLWQLVSAGQFLYRIPISLMEEEDHSHSTMADWD